MNLHKHPYTAVYDFIFSNIRYQNLNIAEIGILDNKSIICWRNYFPNANIFGYEWFDDKIERAKLMNLPNTFYYKMNVLEKLSIENAFSLSGKMYDIIIEDSTHVFEDQIRLVDVAYKYLKPGGILIVEDIFRSADESLYIKELHHLSEYFSSVMFINTEHEKKWSPGWNNDKLLILYRNNVS